MSSSLYSIVIRDRTIAEGAPVFFIAEAGVNHNGDVDKAKCLVDAAVDAGADAVKFQSFRTENLATPSAPKAQYHIETTGASESWFDLLKSQEMSGEMHEQLIRYCSEKGIIFLSTPYDEVSVDLLEELQVPAYKIASTDANNIPFLRYVARKGKPMILSTAMCTLAEVRASVAAIREEGVSSLIVMHCTGSYPAPTEETHMRAMRTLRDEMKVLVGYSDHTMADLNAILCVAFGAVAYERHFTLDRALPGPDHRMSLVPDELTRVVRLVRRAEAASGSCNKEVQPSERENRRVLRKSLVANRHLKRGDVLTRDAIAIKRPPLGIEPARFEEVIGRRLRVDVPADVPIKTEFLE